MFNLFPEPQDGPDQNFSDEAKDWGFGLFQQDETFPLCTNGLLHEHDYEQEFRFLRWLRSLQDKQNR